MNEPSPYFIRRTAQPADEEPIVLDQPINDFDDDKPILREYWHILLKYLWLIVSCAVTALLIGLVYVLTRTTLYTAQSTVLIEYKPPQILNFQGATADPISTAESSFYKTQYETLKSRSLSARVISSEGLTPSKLLGDSGEKKGFLAGLWSSASRNSSSSESKNNSSAASGADSDLVDAYLSLLRIDPVRGTSLVNINFTTANPSLSARLADAHANAYVGFGIDLRLRANEEGLHFLEGKLVELKDRLEKSEEALNAYRRDRGIISLSDKENIVVDRLSDLSRRLTEAEAERIAVEAQVKLIRSVDPQSLPDVLKSALVITFKGQLAQAEGEYLKLAAEFKPGYPALDKAKVQLDNVRRRLQQEVQAQVKAMESAYAAAATKEKELRARMEEQKKATLNLKDAAVEYGMLERGVNTNRQLYDAVLQRMKEMGVAAEVRTSNVSVVENATVPKAPSYPKKGRTLALSLLFGLFAGFGIVFILEHLDDTFKKADDVSRYLHLPSLGMVPDFLKLNHDTDPYGQNLLARVIPRRIEPPTSVDGKELVLSHHPLSVLTESYRTIRTALLLSLAGGPPKTIVFTSATQKEGKTATAVNTAVVYAQMGLRVMLVDADLRRPRCHQVLKMENTAGLSEVLAGQMEAKTAIKKASVENLYFLNSGSVPPNPTELLGSRTMSELLSVLKEEYDCVVIDSAPVLPVSDAIALSAMADGVVIVIDSQNTPKQVVRDACARLLVSGAKILGTVLNKVDLVNGRYSYGYSHYYSYYHNSDNHNPE
jgi:succinoglycan biosynthesis transport protein ExoP